MIQINLLRTPGKPKRQVRTRQHSLPSISLDGMAPILLGLALVAASAGWTALRYRALNVEYATTQAEIKRLQDESDRLGVLRVRYDQRRKEADEYERRVRMIDSLHAAQTGPSTLLTTVADTVGGTDAVWLKSVTDDGRSVSVDGSALSADAVADLAVSLRRSGFFRTVEIKEAYEDPAAKDVRTFVFSLVGERMDAKNAHTEQKRS